MRQIVRWSLVFGALVALTQRTFKRAVQDEAIGNEQQQQQDRTGVLVSLDSLAVGGLNVSGRFSGTLTLTAAQVLHLVKGLTYANIHTTMNSGGEIRGQLEATAP